MEKMIKYLFYTLLICQNYYTYSQILWTGNIAASQWYIPYDNNTLMGLKCGISTITKNKFMMQLNFGYFYNSKMDSIVRINNTEYLFDRGGGYPSYARAVQYKSKLSSSIPYINLLYGFTTHPLQKVSFSFMTGVSLAYYTDSPFLELTGMFPYYINFFNISSQVRIKLKENLFLFHTLFIRSLKHTSIQNDIGVSLLLNKKSQLPNIQFNDTSSKSSFYFDIGFGTGINFLQYYYCNNFSTPNWINSLFKFQTLDIHSALYFKWFLIKYVVKIYAFSYNPQFKLNGNIPVLNNLFIGYSSKYNDKKLFFNIGIGTFVTDNFYYIIKSDTNQFILYDRNRLLFSSLIELGYRLKNIQVSFYLNRVGNWPFESSESQGQGNPVWIYYPQNTHTSLGLALIYNIKI